MINRNNYEEFFLLYVDNELSAAERLAVEQFVAEHTDLKEELSMLQETVLSLPSISFDDKEMLMKPDAAMQERLLSLLDGELKGEERSAAESLISSDKSAADEWAILQQTKLPAEQIIFENKASLYRREPARLVSMRWWRVAAAALLIGFGTWGTVSYFTSTKTADPAATASTKKTPAETDKNDLLPDPSKKEQDVNQANTVSPVTDNNNNLANTNNKQANPDEALVKQNSSSGNKSTPEVQIKQTLVQPAPQQTVNNSMVKNDPKAEEKPSNNLPTPLEKINRDNSNQNPIANVTPPKNEINLTPRENVIKLNENNSAPQNNGAITAAYHPGDQTNAEPDDDESTGKKSKLRGLFRKVKRVFDRTTNSNNNSNAIKVAGFAIAIK